MQPVNEPNGRTRSEPSKLEEWKLISRSSEPLLSVRDLRTYFDTADGTVKAADGVSFEIQEGEILGLVGESGSGKSVTSRSILRLVEDPGYIAGGEINFQGDDLLEMEPEQMRSLRGSDIAMVFQEPMSALNPAYPTGWQVGEPLRIHHGLEKEASIKRATELMRQIGIPSADDRVNDYPHEFSGGMLQRATIAMALACEPKLLIADEPTTALDVTIQAQILSLIQEINERTGMAMLLVTHNLGVVAEICDRVAVMYAGRIVEYGDVEEVFERPRHPYTRGLLDAMIDPDSDKNDVEPIPGEVPQLSDTPRGCNFENRCPFAIDECSKTDPQMREVDDDHFSACIWKEIE